MKLGTILETIFKYTGIKAIVKWIYPNCNCENRKNKLDNFKFNK